MALNILLIDDFEANALIFEHIADHMGFDVSFAYKGAEGLDLAQKEKYDLILIDINLPDISGSKLALSLRELANDAKLVAFTSEISFIDKSDLDNFDLVLQKTFNEDELRFFFQKLGLQDELHSSAMSVN